MAIETFEGMSLVHGIWSTYYERVYDGYTQELDKENAFYIIEGRTQQPLVAILEQKGYTLKHSTTNRRTGNNIFFYVKGETSSPQGELNV